jgi:hypothetical protein
VSRKACFACLRRDTSVCGLFTFARLPVFLITFVGFAISFVLIPERTMLQQETPPVQTVACDQVREVKKTAEGGPARFQIKQAKQGEAPTCLSLPRNDGPAL